MLFGPGLRFGGRAGVCEPSARTLALLEKAARPRTELEPAREGWNIVRRAMVCRCAMAASILSSIGVVVAGVDDGPNSEIRQIISPK